MRTNQIMIRPMGEFTVSQRTKDGYFDAGELLRQWNLSGQEQRKMDVFLNSVSTCKFVEALIAEANEVGLGQNCPKIDNQVVKKSKVKEKGKAGRPKEEVWMHPFLFTKFAMWINPRFEVKVIRFVYDEMIQYRILAGDAYPKMCAAVCSILPKDENKSNNHVENLEWCTASYNSSYGNRNKTNSIPVLQYTLNGEFIAEYPSILQASKIVGISDSTIFRSCTKPYERTRRKNNYKWKFKNEN